MKRQNDANAEMVQCCECAAHFRRFIGAEFRCELCSQEHLVRWLVNGGYHAEDGILPSISAAELAARKNRIKEEKLKLKKLRERFPMRAKLYAKKNRGDWRTEAVKL